MSKKKLYGETRDACSGGMVLCMELQARGATWTHPRWYVKSYHRQLPPLICPSCSRAPSPPHYAMVLSGNDFLVRKTTYSSSSLLMSSGGKPFKTFQTSRQSMTSHKNKMNWSECCRSATFPPRTTLHFNSPARRPSG